MKKTGSVFFLTVVLFVSLISACKSAPPAVPAQEPAPAAPVVQAAPAPEPVAATKPVDQALTDLRDRTEALRTEGLKYGLDAYKSDRWAEAESARNAGIAAYGTDYDEAQSRFGTAIGLYESIRDESFKEIAGDLEKSLADARAAAVDAGAGAQYPEYIAQADAAAAAFRTSLDSADFPSAYDAGQIALMRYRTLERLLVALENQQKIDKNGFQTYDPDDYAVSVQKREEAASAYGTADAAAYEAALEAVNRGVLVLDAGFMAWSADARTRCDDTRMLCDSIRARKSMTGAYDDAVSQYLAAEAAGQGKKWEAAYASYSVAVESFSRVFEEATLKKNAADLAISNAKNRQAESTSLAARADELAPLPEDASGYSEEPMIIEPAATAEPAAGLVVEEDAK